MNQKTKDEADCFILDGWAEYPNQFKKHARCLYKRFPTPTRCSGNSDKDGILVEVAISEGFAGNPSIEIEICGGLQDDSWFNLHNYSLPKSHSEVCALIPRLVATWEFVATYK